MRPVRTRSRSDRTGIRHAAAAGQNPAAIITGKLTSKRRITAVESSFLRTHAPGPYKITIRSDGHPTGRGRRSESRRDHHREADVEASDHRSRVVLSPDTCARSVQDHDPQPYLVLAWLHQRDLRSRLSNPGR